MSHPRGPCSERCDDNVTRVMTMSRPRGPRSERRDDNVTPAGKGAERAVLLYFCSNVTVESYARGYNKEGTTERVQQRGYERKGTTERVRQRGYDREGTTER
eukprot:9325215-Pyramimonas_sp.AAC.1